MQQVGTVEALSRNNSPSTSYVIKIRVVRPRGRAAQGTPT